MKKILSLVLALLMLLGCMSITAFAEEDPYTGSTTITANVADKRLSYEIVIPQTVTMNEAGVKEIGAASINMEAGKLKNATANTVISYTASGTDFKLSTDDNKTMAASYYTDSEGTIALTNNAIDVYKNSKLVDPLTTLYVGVSQTDWDTAARTNPGTYTATVTFNFSAEEKEATKVIIADILPESFPTYCDTARWGNGVCGSHLYVENGNLCAQAGNNVSVPVATVLTPTSGDYNYTCTFSDGVTWKFAMSGDEFWKVNISGAQAAYNENYFEVEGDYYDEK